MLFQQCPPGRPIRLSVRKSPKSGRGAPPGLRSARAPGQPAAAAATHGAQPSGRKDKPASRHCQRSFFPPAEKQIQCGRLWQRQHGDDGLGRPPGASSGAGGDTQTTSHRRGNNTCRWEAHANCALYDQARKMKNMNTHTTVKQQTKTGLKGAQHKSLTASPCSPQSVTFLPLRIVPFVPLGTVPFCPVSTRLANTPVALRSPQPGSTTGWPGCSAETGRGAGGRAGHFDSSQLSDGPTGLTRRSRRAAAIPRRAANLSPELCLHDSSYGNMKYVAEPKVW